MTRFMRVTQVGADLSTLLAPRAQIPKHLSQLKEPWRNRQDGKGNRPHLRSNGKGLKGKHDSSSHAEDAPPERATRGGKGKKGSTSSAGKWLSTLFMEGKQHTLCMRYQQGQCKDPSTCRYLSSLCCAQVRRHSFVVANTQLPNTLALHIRTPASVTSGSQLRWYRMSRFVCQHAQPAFRAHFSPSLQSLPGRAPRPHWPCQPVISVSPLVCRFWRNTFPTPRPWNLLSQTPAITQADAYFNLGALAFSSAQNSFSDIVRLLNSFLLLRFPGCSWSSICVSHNVRTLLHTDAGNKTWKQQLYNFAWQLLWWRSVAIATPELSITPSFRLLQTRALRTFPAQVCNRVKSWTPSRRP